MIDDHSMLTDMITRARAEAVVWRWMESKGA